MTIRAIIFDLGGVVLGSPLHAIADYERELGLPANFVNRVVADTAPTGAWSRLERGEISMETFYDEFEADCRAAGQALSAKAMFERMGVAAQPRPIMLEAIRRIRAQGLLAGALTNNWAHDDGDAGSRDGTRALNDLFDVCLDRGQPVFASCFGFQAAVVGLGGTLIRDETDFEMGITRQLHVLFPLRRPKRPRFTRTCIAG